MPSQYLAKIAVNNTSTAISFGFTAFSLTVQNRSAASIFISLSSAASTDSFEIASSGTFAPVNIAAAGCSFFSSATSTSGAGLEARVLALAP